MDNKKMAEYYWEQVEQFVGGSYDPKALKMMEDKFNKKFTGEELTKIIYSI